MFLVDNSKIVLLLGLICTVGIGPSNARICWIGGEAKDCLGGCTISNQEVEVFGQKVRSFGNGCDTKCKADFSCNRAGDDCCCTVHDLCNAIDEAIAPNQETRKRICEQPGFKDHRPECKPPPPPPPPPERPTTTSTTTPPPPPYPPGPNPPPRPNPSPPRPNPPPRPTPPPPGVTPPPPGPPPPPPPPPTRKTGGCNDIGGVVEAEVVYNLDSGMDCAATGLFQNHCGGFLLVTLISASIIFLPLQPFF